MTRMVRNLATGNDLAVKEPHGREATPPRPIGQLRQIPIGQLVEAPWNGRTDFGNLAELEASIREEGILNPLIARPHGDDVYEVFCGHRRLRAARALGLEELPVIVRPCGDQEARSLAIVDNLQREGLGPMDEARAFGELQRLGLTAAEIAARCVPERAAGVAYVHTRLALLELPEDAQDMVRSGELPLTVATAILRLALPLRSAGVLKVRKALKDGDSARELLGMLERELMLPLKDAQFDTDDGSLAPMGRGACSSCEFRTGNQAALFGEFGGADVCTDSHCYRAKLAETFRRKAEAAEKRGVEVLTGKAAAQVFPYKQSPSTTGHGFLRLDEKTWAGSDYVTVKAVLAHGGEKAPKPMLVQSPHDGSIHEVVPGKVVEKLAQSLHRSKKARQASAADDPKATKAEREEQLRRRQEALRRQTDAESRKAVTAAVGVAAEKALTGIASKPAQAKLLRAIAWVCVDYLVGVGDEGPDHAAVRRGWVKPVDGGGAVVESAAAVPAADLEKAYIAQFPKLTPAAALGLLAELQAWDGNWVGGPMGGVFGTLGVDPKAIRAQVEKRVREEQKAQAAAAAKVKLPAGPKKGSAPTGRKGRPAA